jgi:hypothetical protein
MIFQIPMDKNMMCVVIKKGGKKKIADAMVNIVYFVIYMTVRVIYLQYAVCCVNNICSRIRTRTSAVWSSSSHFQRQQVQENYKTFSGTTRTQKNQQVQEIPESTKEHSNFVCLN